MVSRHIGLLLERAASGLKQYVSDVKLKAVSIQMDGYAGAEQVSCPC